MESSVSKPVIHQEDKQETISYHQEEETKPTNTEEKSYVVIKDEKSYSDANIYELSFNDDQKVVGNSGNSQFYESSDSKEDYAVKVDDNDTLSDIDDIKTDSASADSEDSALGSLPPDIVATDRDEEPQDRSEGSDSGIGSEMSEDVKLPSFNLALPCTNSLNLNNSIKDVNDNPSSDNSNYDEDEKRHKAVESVKIPIRSNLKRKRKETDAEPQTKKRKEGIRFDNVTVYYFPRSQGFSCVPSQGGSTLGMEWEHSHIQKFTLAEHALEQRRLHRQVLQQLKSERQSLQGASLSSSEDSDTEEEASDFSESELDLDSYYFLQPVPTRQRRALLRAAGVRKIEGYEKDECRDIRTSREFCGCACKGTCKPDSCLCSLSGIKCQVDRLNFPCGCTRDGCANTTGRIEFNPVRVRTHFIHTLMRVGLERKNEENQDAAKRRWAEAHNTNPNPITSYDKERCRVNQEDGLLRDVNLTPRVEVESCVNAGNFSNIHCNTSNVAQTVLQDSIPFGYRNDDGERRMISSETNVQLENTNIHHNHADPYSTNMLQGKGPPYAGAGVMGYNTVATNNMQRFPCDLNYSYDQHSNNHHFKGLQSFSASSFEEFAHNSQMSMFSHYGHMYAPEYTPKPNTSMLAHSSVQYHHASQNQYDMYKSAECVNNDVKGDYNSMMTMPYQNSNKIQIAENDENWFSHNTLLNLDHNDQTQDAAEIQPQPAEASGVSTAEITENFGELIKKTMVESVTV